MGSGLVPDLAVEVLSPGDRAGEVEEKIRRLVESGLQRGVDRRPEVEGGHSASF